MARGSSVCVARAGICEWGVCWRRRGVVCVVRDGWGAGYVGWYVRLGIGGAAGIGGVVFEIRYARGAYAGSMVGWVSVAAGDGMRVAGCSGG